MFNKSKSGDLIFSLPKNEFIYSSRSNLQNGQKVKAFTLAEVLITLTIIGVVAAVTVPTLTKKTGNQEYVSRLQKIYAVLSQATDEIILENGSPSIWAANVNTLYWNYKSHLKISKDCGSGTGCFKQADSDNSKLLKYLNGDNLSATWDSDSNSRRVILADGTSVMFLHASSSCNSNDMTYEMNKKICGKIYVDTNGTKGPNQQGRDIYRLIIKQDGLYSSGVDAEGENANYDLTCNPTSTGMGKYGYGCAKRIIEESEMNY